MMYVQCFGHGSFGKIRVFEELFLKNILSKLLGVSAPSSRYKVTAGMLPRKF